MLFGVLFLLCAGQIVRASSRQLPTFADVCGLHRTAVGLLERGKSIPRLDTLLIVSEHLGVTVSELLEGLKH